MSPYLLMPTLGLLGGCALTPIERLTILARQDDGSYALTERTVPELHDPNLLTGALGPGRRGGLLAPDGYDHGGDLDIRWEERDGAGLPTDHDGLVLWSFYSHLARARSDLLDAGFDVEPLFPLEAVAWNPASPMDFAAAENAAYAPASHIFVLFPDMLDTGVPLAANEGVVRHELGHTWFQWIALGAPAPWDTSADAHLVRALNEGFADTVATLSLDDAAFIEASLDLEARDVRGDAQASDGMYARPTGALDTLTHDPYALGTVYASFAWDVREAHGDAEEVLHWAVDALDTWAEEGDWAAVDRYAELLLERATEVPEIRDDVCEAYAFRFPHLPEDETCAS